MKNDKLLNFCATVMALCLFTGCASSVDSNDTSSGNSSVESTEKDENEPVESSNDDEKVGGGIDQEVSSFEDLAAYTTAEQFNMNMGLGLYALAVQTQKELNELYPENLTLTWHTKESDAESYEFTVDFDTVTLEKDASELEEILASTVLGNSIEMFESWTGSDVFLSDWVKEDDFVLILGVNAKGEVSPYTTSAHWAKLGIPMSAEEPATGVMAEKMEEYESLASSENNQNDVIIAYELVKSVGKVIDSMESVPEGVTVIWQGSESPYLKVEGNDDTFMEGIASLVAETPAPTTDFALETPLTLGIAVDGAGEPYVYCVSEVWAETLNMPST